MMGQFQTALSHIKSDLYGKGNGEWPLLKI